MRMTDLDIEEAGQYAGEVAEEGGVGHNNLDKCLKMCFIVICWIYKGFGSNSAHNNWQIGLKAQALRYWWCTKQSGDDLNNQKLDPHGLADWDKIAKEGLSLLLPGVIF